MESVNRVRNTQAFAVMKIGCLKIKLLARSALGGGKNRVVQHTALF
jgi:hypothetical protein